MSNKSEFIEYLIDIGKRIERKRRDDKRYRETHPQLILERARNYRENNREEILKHNKESYNNNPNKFIKRMKEYNKTEKGKVARQRVKARRRDLGFEPLNNYFKGSIAHHLDNVYIVYIPRAVHQSIWHCLGTGENMKEINSYAMNYILIAKDVK